MNLLLEYNPIIYLQYTTGHILYILYLAFSMRKFLFLVMELTL